MEGPLSERVIRVCANRATAAKHAALILGFGGLSLLAWHSCSTDPARRLGTRNAALVALLTPVLLSFTAICLRRVLPAVAKTQTLLEIRDQGLWFPRFGLISWPAIGRIEVLSGKTRHTHKLRILRIEIRDLPDRVRRLGWLSWLDWHVCLDGWQKDSLSFSEPLLPTTASGLAARIEACRPEVPA